MTAISTLTGFMPIMVSWSKYLGGAAKDAVIAPAKVAGKMVTSPVQTTKGIFTGTGRYLATESWVGGHSWLRPCLLCAPEPVSNL